MRERWKAFQGATVEDAHSGEHRQVSTDGSGVYHLSRPQPRPAYIHLQCTRNGYVGEERSFSSSKPPDDWPLEKVHSP